MIEAFLALLTGFLLGSLPCGFWLAQAKGVNIQKRGSGNIGATNVGRVLGRRWGYLVFALDALKGWLAVWLARDFLQAGDTWTVGAGVAAVAGHVFSPWLSYKGGKGVATSAGVLFALAPAALLWTAGLWGVTFAAKKTVSIASLAAATAFPFLVLWLEPGRPALQFAAWALAALVWYRHRENLQRLRQGVENTFDLERSGKKKRKKKK